MVKFEIIRMPRDESPLQIASPATPRLLLASEALPLGNGSLGGMLFGLTSTERIQVNANTRWTGNEQAIGAYQDLSIFERR